MMFIVINDYGCYLFGMVDGFVSYGDNCEGCWYIEFFVLLFDFK